MPFSKGKEDPELPAIHLLMVCLKPPGTSSESSLEVDSLKLYIPSGTYPQSSSVLEQ